MVYIGAVAAFLDMELEVLKQIVDEQFARKPKLIPANYQALDLGYNYAKEHYNCPLPIRVERRDKVGDHIMMEGNDATGLGAIYAGSNGGSMVSHYSFYFSCAIV